jgi:hypothetical protein
MLVLFDQGTPVAIRHSLPEHTVRTATELGWNTLLNGELLRAAELAGFDVFLTTDTNRPYQQNLKGYKLAVMVLSKNRWKLIRPMLPQIADTIASAEPGTCFVVEIPIADAEP